MPSLSASLVDRWFERVMAPPTEPGGQWPLAVDIRLTPAERSAVREGQRRLRLALGAPAGPDDGEESGWAQDEVGRQIGVFLGVLSAAVGDARRTLGAGAALSGADAGTEAGAGVERVDSGLVDALAVAAGINAGAAALAGSVAEPDPPQWPTGSRWAAPDAGPTAAEVARRAGEAAAEAAVGGAGLEAVAARSAAAVLSGWGTSGPVRPGDTPEAAPDRVRAVVGRVLVGLQQATRPPDPPALPAPCGAGPGDVHGRGFIAEITCEMAVADTQLDAVGAELREVADLVRFWPRSSAGAAGAAGLGEDSWQRVHVHTGDPGAVVEVLFASAAVFDLRITALD